MEAIKRIIGTIGTSVHSGEERREERVTDWTAAQRAALRDLDDALDRARSAFSTEPGVRMRLKALAIHLEDLRGLDPAHAQDRGRLT